MRTVSPGELIRPALTAQWYNNTLRNSPQKNAPLKMEADWNNTIVPGFYKYSTPIKFLEPVGIESVLSENAEEFTCGLTDEIDEYNWAVAHRGLKQKSTADVCISGMTLAKVNILSTEHKYVTYTGNQLESSTYGKAQLLAQPKAGSEYSLINLGVYGSASGAEIIYTSGAIPARSGSQCGSRTCTLCLVTEDGKLYDTTTNVTVWNMITEATSIGYMQAKTIQGKLFVDVVPCTDDDGPLGPPPQGLRSWWTFRGWT